MSSAESLPPRRTGGPERPRPLTYVPSDDRADETHAETLHDELIALKLFTAARLKELDKGDRPLAVTLIDAMLIGDRELADIEKTRTGRPFTNLRRTKLDKKLSDILSEQFLRRHVVVPLRSEDGSLVVATCESSSALRQLIEEEVMTPVVFEIATASDIRFAIDQQHRALDNVSGFVQAFQSADTDRRVEQSVLESIDVDAVLDDAPVVRTVNDILAQARRDRASDVHIEPLESSVRVRFRIDGVLSEVLQLPTRMGAGVVSRIKIMAAMNIVDKRRPQDGQFSTSIDGEDLDVRVSTVSTIQGESCVMRLLDKQRSAIALSRLGMPADTYERYSALAHSPYGMLVCVGPTGSGKTTTLYATLSEISDVSVNVMTIEDPVEVIVPTINQIQTNNAADLTFAAGLRSILRQDPDVILVGEIRDQETARVAVQSAMTGHLVVSSLHANTAVSALARFVDMGVEPFMVASSLLAVVSQRLLRRICQECATPYKLSAEEMAFYEASGGEPKDKFFKGRGCATCARTGYRDRIGVYEMLTVTEDVRRLVVTGAHQFEIEKHALETGMRTMRQEAVALVQQDVTTISEAMKSVYSL